MSDSGYSCIRCHSARAAHSAEPRTCIQQPLRALREQTGGHGRIFCRHSFSKAKWVLSCRETISLEHFSVEMRVYYLQTNYLYWSAPLGVPANMSLTPCHGWRNLKPRTWSKCVLLATISFPREEPWGILLFSLAGPFHIPSCCTYSRR